MSLGSVVSKATFAPAHSSRCADWFTGVTQQSVTSCPRSYARAEAAQTHTSATRKREMWSQPQTAMMQDEGWEYARRQTVTLTDSRYQLLAFLRALVGEKSKTTFVNSANRELLSPRCHRGHYDGSPTTVGTSRDRPAPWVYTTPRKDPAHKQNSDGQSSPIQRTGSASVVRVKYV